MKTLKSARILILAIACAAGLTAFGQTVATPAAPTATEKALAVQTPQAPAIEGISFVADMTVQVGEFTIQQGWTELNDDAVSELVAKAGCRLATADEIKQFSAKATPMPKSAAERLVFVAMKSPTSKIAETPAPTVTASNAAGSP